MNNRFNMNNRTEFENIIFQAVNNMITNEILNITEDETMARAIDEACVVVVQYTKIEFRKRG